MAQSKCKMSSNEYTEYFTNSSKKDCTANLMRDAIELLSLRDGITYEDALLHFTNSKIYNALFDYDTGIWKEGHDYLLNLYDYCNFQKCKPKII